MIIYTFIVPSADTVPVWSLGTAYSAGLIVLIAGTVSV